MYEEITEEETMLFVNNRKKKLKNRLFEITNKGITVNIRIYKNKGLSVY